MGSRETAGQLATLTRVRRGFRAARPRTVAGTLALLAAAVPFLARVLVNARAMGGLDLAARMDFVAAVGLVGPAMAAGLLAGTTSVETERVGLAFVAAFGVLSMVSPAATLPAAVGVVAGGALAVGARWRALPARTLDWRLSPVVGILAGVGLSLAGATGVAPPAARVVGAHLSLLGAAATPALVGHANRDWAFGGIVAGLLVAVGLTAPFLTGAVVLVGGGIVGVSLPVIAAGLCGVVTTASAGVRLCHAPAVLGAGLLLVAGVPATLPRALAVVLGAVVLVETRGGTSA